MQDSHNRGQKQDFCSREVIEQDLIQGKFNNIDTIKTQELKQLQDAQFTNEANQTKLSELDHDKQMGVYRQTHK